MKKFVAGFISCAVLMLCVPALADTAKNVTALLGQNKVFFEGIPLEVDTLLYEDTTYIPLRAAAEAIGKEVTYDDATKTVYIGRVPKK